MERRMGGKAAKRYEGGGGWQDSHACTTSVLREIFQDAYTDRE
jgi:hypothetical protein